MLRFCARFPAKSQVVTVLHGPSVRRNGEGTGGSGTVRNADGIFSDREAAIENRYFRQKTAEDLKRLKMELKARKQEKKERQAKPVEDQEGGDDQEN